MRTYFQGSMPEEICESAYIDGCSNMSTLLRIVLPLSTPIIAVMVIFYGVGHWNTYFNALLYLKTRDKFPLSLVLREILLQGMGQEKTGLEVIDSVADLLLFETLKYAVIIVSSAPMLVLYPALQRYFVKGAMIGSLKG
jgi:putative aldouronate transport system permease protein